jgi:hypothetical protein
MQKISTVLNLIDWAEVGSIVVHGVVTLAVLTYWIGWGVGRFMHDASASLGRLHVAALNLSEPAPVVIAEPVVTVSAAAQPDALTARIVALRAQGLSQRAVADAVGVSRATVRRRLAATA